MPFGVSVSLPQIPAKPWTYCFLGAARWPGIAVHVPSVEQLLAMKLCAWRDDVDIADAKRLLPELTGAHDEVWKRVEAHLFPGRELIAKYAFEDLWETTHGNG
jgi:hypothetical protein